MSTSKYDTDVLVAGAGVGGATAAYYLARAGLRVVVVDKARLPRDKPCGGAIPQAALARFPFALDEVVRARPASVRFTFPHLPHVEVALPGGPIAMVRRSEFDARLLAEATALGAEVWDGTAVTGLSETPGDVRVELGGRAVTARYLVGADGAASTIARRLSLRRRRRLGATLEAEVPLDGDRRLVEAYGNRSIFALGALPWGYAWSFPKGDRLAVGIGRFRPGRTDLRAALRREMDRLGIRLDGVAVHGHPIPYYQAAPWPFWHGRPQEPLHTRRAVLVGDAAGLVDPFCGEGIRYALKSARLAAEAIARDDLSGYEQAVWRDIGHSLATAGLVSQWIYRVPALCYILGTQNPGLIRHFTDIMLDRYSYQGVGRRIIGLTILWLTFQIDDEGKRRS